MKQNHRTKQTAFLKKPPLSYGGTLLKTRKGRRGPRPLSTRDSMHLVLRSSKATCAWSFNAPANAARVRAITQKFAAKHGVRILKLANVGNHLHFHLKLTSRHTYKPFIRAITAAIAMAVTGASRWRPLKKQPQDRFWDYRPFTRVIQSFRALLTIRDYLMINELEGQGLHRINARLLIGHSRTKSKVRRSACS